MRRRTLAALTVLVGSLAATRSPAAQRLDRGAGRALARPLGDAADVAIGTATDLGSVYALLGTAAVLGASGRRRAAARVVAAGALGWTAAQAVKPLVGRPRPFEADGARRIVTRPAGASWPSGHVAVAAGMTSAMADELPPAGTAATGALALFVAHSRIYVGVHYLTDVLAGLGLGVLAERAVAAVQSWLTSRFLS